MPKSIETLNDHELRERQNLLRFETVAAKSPGERKRVAADTAALDREFARRKTRRFRVRTRVSGLLHRVFRVDSA